MKILYAVCVPKLLYACEYERFLVFPVVKVQEKSECVTVMILCFHTYGEFFPPSPVLLLRTPLPPASRPISQPQGPNGSILV